MIFLLFDGIHYDVIVRSITEDFNKNFDTLTFSLDDKHALEGAKVIANNLAFLQQFTDVDRFNIQCGICLKCFIGQ